MTFRQYFWNLMTALSQLLNATLGGDCNETLSSRMGKDILLGKCKMCRVVCWLLDKVDSNHCIKEIGN